jgi:16S rRNA processing protein RimM
MPERARKLCVGVVIGAHGIKGAVRVKTFTVEPSDVAAYGPVSDEAGVRRYAIKVLSASDGQVVASLAGVADRNAAEALKGLRLFVDRSALPAVEGVDEYYVQDLVGLSAEDGERRVIGKVIGAYDFGAGEVLELSLADGAVVMLPFTRATVPVVDLAGGRIVVEIPYGARPEEGVPPKGERAEHA